ncbi:MAG: hypothetical protein JWN63_3431 [Candidatus Acidoferrum typicum]|nr:hypothetical protein [Candidatus Acidoferrum typicum]
MMVAGLAEERSECSPRTVDDLLSDLREVCTCIGENRANEGDELCLFCDARLQIEAQQQTITRLYDRLRKRCPHGKDIITCPQCKDEDRDLSRWHLDPQI